MKKYRLRYEVGHFEGKLWPEGTEVQGVVYDRDPQYIEILTPDGFLLVVEEGAEVAEVIEEAT